MLEGVEPCGRSGHDGTMAHPPRSRLAKPDRGRPSSGVYQVWLPVLFPRHCVSTRPARIRRFTADDPD